MSKLTSYAQYFLQDCPYPARMANLRRYGICEQRQDLDWSHAKPRVVECLLCGVVVDLGPIENSSQELAKHLMKRHVPSALREDIYKVADEGEGTLLELAIEYSRLGGGGKVESNEKGLECDEEEEEVIYGCFVHGENSEDESSKGHYEAEEDIDEED